MVYNIAMTKKKENSTYRTHPPEVRSKILELKNQYVKDKDIAASLGVEFSYVRSVLRAAKKKGYESPKDLRSFNAAHKSQVDDIVKVSELVSQNLTTKQIADNLGKTPNQVYTLRKYTNVKPNLSVVHEQYSDELKNKIVDLRLKDRKTLDEISVELNLSRDTVRYICAQKGINLFNEKVKNSGSFSIEDYINIFAQKRNGRIVGKYEGMNLPILFKCEEEHHREFLIRPADVIDGHWCPTCGHVNSRAESEIEEFIKSIYPEVKISRNETGIIHNRKNIDVYLPDLKIGFEHHGLRFHGKINIDKNREAGVSKDKAHTKHLEKLELCESQGIRLIQIFEDEWLTRRSQVEGFIRSILNKQENLIGARECGLFKGNNNDVRQFFEDNHLQGLSGNIIYYLKFENKIVAGISFKVTNDKRKGATIPGFYELTRYCVKGGWLVKGAFQRLLKAFVRDYTPIKIISFSDKRWSVGGLYNRNGFRIERVDNPNYTYFKVGSKFPRYPKAQFRLEKIKKKFNIDITGKHEWELMQSLGYDKIYDCGKYKWVLDFPPKV
jgi:DNA-binding CsgD family transcriptional regulator